jgi:hypothetical protein
LAFGFAFCTQGAEASAITTTGTESMETAATSATSGFDATDLKDSTQKTPCLVNFHMLH